MFMQQVAPKGDKKGPLYVETLSRLEKKFN